MDNVFRVISAADLASARASGLVPRCPSDDRSGHVHLNHREDVARVATLYFTPDEAPVALELRRSDMETALAFAPASPDKPFRQVALAWPNIPFSSVVQVHRLQWVLEDGRHRFAMAE
ncbi:MAG: DUF952 domain-containing protein [Pseudomonadota bacterium]|nr:DUF952 domain-containing protein [Pseudomonadota bacterium]